MFINPTYQNCHLGLNPIINIQDVKLDTLITYREGGGQRRYLKVCPQCNQLFFYEIDIALSDRYGWSEILAPVPSHEIADFLHQYSPFYVDAMRGFISETPFPAYLYWWGDEFGSTKGGKWYIEGSNLYNLAEWQDWCKQNISLNRLLNF